MVFQLDRHTLNFPDPSLAQPDGLLAIGGDLSVARLISAYQNGIFPWYDEQTPILWYAPLLRFVLNPKKLRISKSLRQVIRSERFRITENQCFEQVVARCATMERKDQDGTWILPEMQKAYLDLHHAGYAHSIEIWENNQLMGGLYGVQIGKVFCGESMFSQVSNTSKIALVHLSSKVDIELIDCQVPSEHLKKMGAELISQQAFLNQLKNT